jgi:subtilisin family serine protease
MMKLTIRLLIVGCALLVAASNAPLASADDGHLENNAFGATSADAERIVLVLYQGQPASRLPSGARANMYRGRGSSYASNPFDHKQAESLAHDHHIEYLADWRITEIGQHCAVYRIPVGGTIEDTMMRLEADKRVQLVQRMATFQTMSSPYSDPLFNQQASATYFKLVEAHEIATGRNVKIAIVDTGVALEHPDLVGQIASSENFAESISPGFSEDAHGTAVAGIIVAKSDNGQGIVGVAPDSQVMALKACWPTSDGAFEAHCNSFTLALAINSAIRAGVAVLNLSLTGPPDPVIELLIQEASRRNIIVVAAIAPDQDTDIGFPASMPEVIAVRTDDSLFNQTLRRVELFAGSVAAPGREILTTVPNGRYDFLSGSSLAAAQVSGYVALIKELHPHITARTIREHLLLGSDELHLKRFVEAVADTKIVNNLPRVH